MAKKSARELLLSFVGSQKKVHLSRRVPGGSLHNGYIVAIGREWVLLQQFHDFFPDGYSAFRIKSIKRVRSGKFERFWERIFAAEGLTNQAAIVNELPLNDDSGLLTALCRRADNIIVECEERTDGDAFFIGRILSVEFDSISFAHFSGEGKWDDVPRMINFEDITAVQLDTPYTKIISKYIDGPCPHE